MKKTVVIVALLALILWGVYDISNNESKQYIDAQKEQMAAEHPDTDSIVGLEQGNLAPDFTLSTPQGKSMKLSDFRGKKVILNMWATWCPPCKAEMPHLQSYFDDHQAEGVEVFAINLTQAEKNKEDVPRFIRDYELTFPVVLDKESRVADLYQVTTIPTTFILDSSGKIEQRIEGPLTYEMMDELINQVK